MNNSDISISDLGEKNLLDNEGDYLDINSIPKGINQVIFQTSKLFSDKLDDDLLFKDIGTVFEIDGIKYTLTDIRNFKIENQKHIYTLLNERFGLDITTDEGLSSINRNFSIVKNIFKSRYGKSLMPSVENSEIGSIEDIVRIMKLTDGKKSGVTYCALLKLFRSYGMIEGDDRIKQINKIHDEILSDLSLLLTDGERISKKKLGGKIRLSNGNFIDSYIYHRTKSLESILGKSVGNINYNIVDDYKDLHGFTYEVDTEKEQEIIEIMQQIYGSICDTSGGNISYITVSNKGIISSYIDDNGKVIYPILDDMLNQGKISQDFHTFCKLSLTSEIEKESDKNKVDKGTAENYQDIKFEVMYETDNPANHGEKIQSGTEIKIVKKGNKNDKGLSFHPIYGYKKLFRELGRLVGFIRVEDLLYFSNNFFNNLQSDLDAIGKSRSQYLRELLIDMQEIGIIDKQYKYNFAVEDNIEKELRIGLFVYFENELKLVKAKKTGRGNFYVHKGYENNVPHLQPQLHEIKKEKD